MLHCCGSGTLDYKYIGTIRGYYYYYDYDYDYYYYY